jgi:hypothetical protein
MAPLRFVQLASLCAIALGASTSGCASSYRAPRAAAASSPEADDEPAPEVVRMGNLSVLGFFGNARTDVRDVCESGVAEHLAIRTTWLTTFATVATLGLYSPLEVAIVCAPVVPDAEAVP